MNRYFVLYKPFQVLSQFTSEEGKTTLAVYYKVSKDIYPVGRLDYDSEGLLVLTNDKHLNHQLLSPSRKHEREYWVQVEGQVTASAIDQLTGGVAISINTKTHYTLPCKAAIITTPPDLPSRNPPIRFRKNIPDSWIKIILHEGKNRQVRKMTAAVGLPTLRLVRYRIEDLVIDELEPGTIKEYSQKEIYHKLRIKI